MICRRFSTPIFCVTSNLCLMLHFAFMYQICDLLQLPHAYIRFVICCGVCLFYISFVMLPSCAVVCSRVAAGSLRCVRGAWFVKFKGICILMSRRFDLPYTYTRSDTFAERCRRRFYSGNYFVVYAITLDYRWVAGWVMAYVCGWILYLIFIWFDISHICFTWICVIICLVCMD